MYDGFVRSVQVRYKDYYYYVSYKDYYIITKLDVELRLNRVGTISVFCDHRNIIIRYFQAKILLITNEQVPLNTLTQYLYTYFLSLREAN